MSGSPLRHGQAPTTAAGRRTSSITMEQASHSVAAPRAHPTKDRRWVSQPQDQLGCETAWSPASPSSYACDLLSMSFSDAIQEAAALSKPPMRRTTGNRTTDYHHHSHPHSNSIEPKTERSDDADMSTFELDHDMLGMLANHWNLDAGPPRAPVANWGFEPTQLHDPNPVLMTGSNQHTPLSGSMMLTSGAEMTHIMGMTASDPGFVSGAMDNNMSTTQPPMGPTTDPFSSMDSGFVMPYQDCATLPVSDFPLYDNGMYKPAFDNAAQFVPHVTDNHLGEVSAPFFSNNGAPQSMMNVGPTFHGNSNATTLFNEVAQPPAASMTVINGGFVVADLSLQEDEDSDWNGSSSDFSTVSSSPIAKQTSSTPTAAVAPGPTCRISITNKDGSKKPKRIRRLCSVSGCGKRARSQDLCIAHGGGRRCIVDGCEKSSQGGNMCIKHGGGKRCRHPGCDKAAQTHSLCKAHGGGPRCQYTGCTKSSQGGGFCRAHGGGKRCAAEGCNKGTQRGDFCALHGGSRFCEIPGCMRNDRGGGFCAHHGGGKRCNIANCNRSCRRNGLCSTHLRLLGNESGTDVVVLHAGQHGLGS